jgi:mannose/fructose/N-acetylgalactosamine-specific phosphotransferase system component IIC
MLYENRTKTLGYLGVIAGAVQMAILAGQHWQLVILGAVVAALGHYNDSVRDQPPC